MISIYNHRSLLPKLEKVDHHPCFFSYMLRDYGRKKIYTRKLVFLYQLRKIEHLTYFLKIDFF